MSSGLLWKYITITTTTDDAVRDTDITKITNEQRDELSAIILFIHYYCSKLKSLASPAGHAHGKTP